MTFSGKESAELERLVQDRTKELEKMNEALRRSEKRFQEMVDLLPQAVFEANRQGVLTYANRHAFDLFNYTQDDFQKGLNVVQMLIPEDRGRAERAIRAVLTGNPPAADREYRALPKEGHSFPVEIYSVPIVRQGSVVGMRGILIDISERKRAEEMLAQEEVFTRLLLDTVGALVVVLDPNGRIRRFNRTCESTTDYREPEVLGRCVWEFLIPPDDLPGVQEIWSQLRAGDFPKTHENRWQAKNGSQRFVAWSNTATFDDTGRLQYIVGTGLDITERKETEERLRENERKFRTAFDNSHDAITLTTAGGMVLDCNHRALELFGLANKDGFLNRRPADFSPSLQPDGRDSREASREHVRTVLDGKRPVQFEWVHQRLNGETFPAEIILTAYEFEGETVLQATIRDITERKAAEEAREATVELLRLCNKAGSLRELMKDLTRYFQQLTGCKAVGVRLREGEDFPYYEAQGFPAEFVLLENRLCAIDLKEELVRDTAGNPVLECMCGNILCGRFDPSKPFFTPHGSFWTSCTTELLARTTDADRQARTRNRCNGEGYESVALVPLRLHGETFGLFQFNDKRRGLFTAQKITLLEQLTDYVAIALAKMKADEALRESSRFNEQITKSAGEGIVVHGRDLRFKAWNPFMEELSGVPTGEVLGKHPLEVFPFLGEAGVIERLEKALAGQASAVLEFSHNYPRNGRLGWLSDTYAPLRNSNGEIVGVIATVRDITERKQAEEALRRSEERFRELYDGAPVGYIEYGPEGRIMDTNRTILEMVGYEREEMIGRHVWNLGLEAEEVRKRVLAKLAGTRPPDKNFERTYIRKDGTTFPVLIEDGLVLNERGEIKSIRTTIQDVTGQKQAEKERTLLSEQFHQAQKMESIGRLAGGVAHDFNNMLGAIIGYAEMAMMKADPESSLNHDLEEILKAADRSANLTRQLLAFARKQVIKPKVLSLNDTVSGMLKMLRRLIGEDIRLVWEPGPNLWEINGDPSQIDQILANLAVNARDAIPGVGTIALTTGNVSIDKAYCDRHPEFTPGEYVALALSDTGTGMSREVLDHIFEPFFTTKEEGKGTGLGLATVYGIVKQNNGYIDVESDLGKGTTFRIYLPRYKVADGREELKEKAENVSGGTETVLLVEDEETMLRLGYEILKRLGYQVFSVQTPSEAIRFSQEHEGKIDLLLTDVVMPEMNGRELAERLTAIRPELKVLYMSGYTADMISRQGIIMEGAELIEKPFRRAELAGAIRKVLNGKSKNL